MTRTTTHHHELRIGTYQEDCPICQQYLDQVQFIQKWDEWAAEPAGTEHEVELFDELLELREKFEIPEQTWEGFKRGDYDRTNQEEA